LKKYNNTIEQNNSQKAEILANRKSKANSNNIQSLNNELINTGFNNWAVRRIRIPSMGLWNCDKPMLPPGTALTPSFVNNYDKEVFNDEIYIVEKDKNQLYRLPGNIPQISVNTRSENVIWTVTDENKIAIASENSVNNIEKGKANRMHTFEVKEYEALEGCKKVKDLLEGKTEQSVEEKKEVKTKTYPNPFTNYVTIDLSEKHECIVQLLKTNGQLVDNITFYGSKYEWKLNKYKSGSYIVVVLIPSIKYKESFKIVKK